MTLVTSRVQDWVDEGVDGTDGVIIFQPAMPILDAIAGVATTTAAVQMRLENGSASRVFDPTAEGQAVAVTFAEMEFPPGPYYVVIPDMETISVVELLLNHQIPESLLQPFPQGDSALALIQGLQEQIDALPSGGGISVDTDGVYYFDPAGELSVGIDTDGVPYVVG